MSSAVWICQSGTATLRWGAMALRNRPSTAARFAASGLLGIRSTQESPSAASAMATWKSSPSSLTLTVPEISRPWARASSRFVASRSVGMPLPLCAHREGSQVYCPTGADVRLQRADAEPMRVVVSTVAEWNDESTLLIGSPRSTATERTGRRERMYATAIIWTAVVIVAVLIIIGIIVAVSRKAAAKKREHQREEAARIRQETAESEHQLHAREAEAQQRRAEAKQADADAEVQAAEAKRRQ